MQRVLHYLTVLAEMVMACLAGVMFFAFIIQIGSRYLFNNPTAWTHEIILITWIWMIFWGAAFLLKDQDHVKFDVLYNLGSEQTRRKLSLIAAACLAICFMISIPATWDFITFKAIRSSDELAIRMDLIFGVYMLFLIGTVVHYGLRFYRLMRGDSLATLEREETL